MKLRTRSPTALAPTALLAALSCGTTATSPCDAGTCVDHVDASAKDARPNLKDASVLKDASIDASDAGPPLRISPTSLLLTPAAATTLTVSAAPSLPSLTISLRGLPAGVSAMTSNAALTGGGAVTFTVSADSTVASGTTEALALGTDKSGAAIADVALPLIIQTPGSGLDTSFAIGGQDIVSVGPGNGTQGVTDSTVLYHLVLLPDDMLLAVGASSNLTTAKNGYALLRFEATGALDSTFGSGGTVFTSFVSSFGDIATSGYALPDGGIFVGGGSHVGLVNVLSSGRYSGSGVLDTSDVPCDGGECFVPVPVSGDQSGTIDFAALDGGTLVMSGLLDSNGDLTAGACLTRLDLSGTVDPTYADAGWAVDPIQYPTSVVWNSVAGASFVMGAQCSQTFSVICRTTIVEHDANGAIVPAFGQGGRVNIPENGDAWGAGDGSIIVDGDGNLLVATSSFIDAPGELLENFSVQVARILLPQGTFDPNFAIPGDAGESDAGVATPGVLTIPLGSVPCDPICGGPSLALQSDGSVIVSDTYSLASGSHVAVLLRVTKDGQPDLSFGSEGRVVYSALLDHDTTATNIVIQPSTGRIVLGGNVGTFAGDDSMYLAGFLANGRSDASTP